jgi:hypothetical protein
MLAVSMSSDHGTHDAKGLKEDHAAQSQQNNPRAFLQITGNSVSSVIRFYRMFYFFEP